MLQFHLRRDESCRMTSRRRISNMFISQRKLQVLASLATVLSLLSATSCTGFFQNPTVTTLTIGPATLNLNQDATQQMYATATYDDGSTKNLTSGVVWTSSDTSVASISNSGIVTGVSAGGPATITGEYATVSGTATVTVVLANVTSIKIVPSTIQIAAAGGTATCTAMATVSGQSTPVDVSPQVTWSINSSDFTITQEQTPATITAQSSSTPGETATVTATYTGTSSTFTATAQLTAH